MAAAHQHPCQEKHGEALATTRGTEISAALAIAVNVDVRMLQDMLVKFVRGEELRITAHDFLLAFRVVGEKHKILNDAQQAFFSEQSLHHRVQGIDAIGGLVGAFHLAPRIEKIVVGKQGAVFVVHAVADDHEGIVSEQIGNIPAVAHRQLGESVHDGGVLLHGTLELQHHHRQTVDINDAIGDAFLRAFDFQLIDNLEDIPFGMFKVDGFNEQVGQRSILALDAEAFHQAMRQGVLLIERSPVVGGQASHHTVDFQRRNVVLLVAFLQVKPQVVAQQHLRQFLVDGLAILIHIALLFKQFHDGHFEAVFVEVGHGYLFVVS